MTKKCQIIINDEVTCRLQGVELNERKALVKKFEFFVPGARYLPSVRLGRWNGKTSFFSLGGGSYINLLPDIIPILDNAGYEIELVDSRDYLTSFTFEVINDSSFSNITWPNGHPIAGQPIVLRDYQTDVINKFLANTQCLQCVATAAGKCLSGETKIVVSIDENSTFGRFMINKLQREQENDVTRNNKEK